MLGKTAQIHAEKIYLEFPVDVVEFIFVFSVAAFEIFLINLFEIVKVVRTFGIDAFVDHKVFAVFLVNQRVIAVRAFQGVGLCKTVFIRRECSGAYFAQDLSLRAVILVEIRFWSIAAGTGARIVDITCGPAMDRFDFLAILPLDVRDVIVVVPFLVIDDLWKFINFELLILWRMRIIESPFFERDISTDKI